MERPFGESSSTIDTCSCLIRSRMEASSGGALERPAAGSAVSTRDRAGEAASFFTRTGFTPRAAAAIAATCSGRVP